jgi:uroporphyrinogen decarboxylase
MVPTPNGLVRYSEGGLQYLRDGKRERPCGLHCGSLYGVIRNWLGLVEAAYLMADDEELFDEIIETVARLCFRCTEYALAGGARYDYGHFWEDICFKNGPLIAPKVFAEKVGPHYRRITDLLKRHGVAFVSVDCDGWIDSLVPVWLENGVNTMFPIEVGTWRASIAPWRKIYGRRLLGVGGMNKHIFARDHQAVDAEIERLEALVALGGYLPCPDHRIADDALWDNVRYYCSRMHEVFGTD